VPPPKYKAVISLDDGVAIYLESTVEQIQDEIAKTAGSRVPLIRVVDTGRAELWINADHIRAFHRGNVVQLETGVSQTDSDAQRRRGRLPFRLFRREP
jgi:hypothetical protein